jgi:hypothetical protein
MSQAQVENKDGWMLSSLQISHYSWEKNSPYRGKITFKNTQEETLSFNIPQDKMTALLALISDSVVDSAQRLGHRMAQSVVDMVKQQAPALQAPAHEELTPELSPEEQENLTKEVGDQL